MICMARLSCLLPPKFTRCPCLAPEETCSGAIPASVANAAAEWMRISSPNSPMTRAATTSPTPSSSSSGVWLSRTRWPSRFVTSAICSCNSRIRCASSRTIISRVCTIGQDSGSSKTHSPPGSPPLERGRPALRRVCDHSAPVCSACRSAMTTKGATAHNQATTRSEVSESAPFQPKLTYSRGVVRAPASLHPPR